MRAEYDFSKGKRGPVIPAKGKTRITIFIDNDVLAAFRERAERESAGYQTLVNEALRASLERSSAPLTVESLRHVLRQELPAYAAAAKSGTKRVNAKPPARKARARA